MDIVTNAGCYELKQLLLWEERQRFFPYWLWEDYLAGMYQATLPSQLEESVSVAMRILSDARQCEDAMRACVTQWKCAASENLSDSTKNRRPWLGRACCCIAAGVKEDAVRVAWWSITEDQREQANAIADKIIREWEVANA